MDIVKALIKDLQKDNGDKHKPNHATIVWAKRKELSEKDKYEQILVADNLKIKWYNFITGNIE
jgi:ribosomal protein RSM22 (predicted rRNA methylase)